MREETNYGYRRHGELERDNQMLILSRRGAWDVKEYDFRGRVEWRWPCWAKYCQPSDARNRTESGHATPMKTEGKMTHWG